MSFVRPHLDCGDIINGSFDQKIERITGTIKGTSQNKL